MRNTPMPAPPRTQLPEGSLVVSPRAIAALRALLLGDQEDVSPSLRRLERVLSDTQCDGNDRATILQILGVSQQ